MKIIHVADTHLGYSAYRKVTQDGINQREYDNYQTFKQFIDYTIQTKPDLILHSGDLYDSVRPTNRAITYSIDQIMRLSKNKIPIIIIAGNHEQPKLKETGHIFSIFDHIEYVHPIYKTEYETHSFTIKKEKITIHAIPQTNTKKDFENNLKKLKKDKTAKYNILVAHGAVTGIKEFKMNEFNELIIPTKTLSKDFDYIALGHYHKYTQLQKNAFYAGSTERYTFTDAKDKKGFIELELNKTNLKTKFIELKTRPMIDTKPIDCTNLPLEKVMTKIKTTIQTIQPKEKTFRIKLKNIPSHTYRGLDFTTIRKLGGEATHYELKADIIKEGETKTKQTSTIDPLENEFQTYIKKQEIKEKTTMLELGLNYIKKIQTRDEGK